MEFEFKVRLTVDANQAKRELPDEVNATRNVMGRALEELITENLEEMTAVSDVKVMVL